MFMLPSEISDDVRVKDNIVLPILNCSIYYRMLQFSVELAVTMASVFVLGHGSAHMAAMN